MLNRGQLLRRLLEAHLRGDDEEFRASALDLIAEERRANNHRLAEDLLRILNNSSLPFKQSDATSWTALPRDTERDLQLVDVLEPKHSLADLVLADELTKDISRFLDEFRRADLFLAHSIPPRSKVLLYGPAGCGKTLLAEAMASELGLPLMYVRVDSVVSSFLGETNANLRKIFDRAAASSMVVFFDEFDAIGKDRGDPEDHGELKRVVNGFLQMIDRFRGRSLIAAATNHETLLDTAIWRRFDEVYRLEEPSRRDIERLIAMKMRSFRTHGLLPKNYAPRLHGLTHADIERICFDSIRSAIYEGREAVTASEFEAQIAKHWRRLRGEQRTKRKKHS
jgi:SpoVK/Ycf46/Vps4 family AAA+-type ATPase